MDTSKRRKLTERELFWTWVPIHAATCLLWTWVTQPLLKWVLLELNAWGVEYAVVQCGYYVGNVILTGILNHALFRVLVSRLITSREEGEQAEEAERLPEFQGVATGVKVPDSLSAD